MTTPAGARLCAAISPVLLAITLFLSGCASDDGPRPPAGNGSPRAPLPNLTGQESFFDGKIVAEMKVGAMTGFTPRGEPGGGESEGKLRGRGVGGLSVGGVGMGGGGHGGGGYGGGGRPPPSGGDRAGPPANPDDGDRQRQLATRRADRMGAPPVMIHLRFSNTSSERVDLEVMDFLSPLGNFVVTPGKLSLEPGQAVAVEPMTSRLAGEVTGGEISLNLRSENKRESKTITLKVEPAVPAPGTPPAP